MEFANFPDWGVLLSGINILVTIFTMRAPGMSLMKNANVCVDIVLSMVPVISAFPILTMTLILLSLDGIWACISLQQTVVAMP